jgi:hypothetical protein
MAAVYDDTGGGAEWRVKAGDPIAKTWLVTEKDDAGVEVAVDVSGATLTGAIRRLEDSTSTAVATFTMSKPAVSGSNAVKALVAAGIAAPGPYFWAIKVAMGDGETVHRGQGPFIVEPAAV